MISAKINNQIRLVSKSIDKHASIVTIATILGLRFFPFLQEKTVYFGDNFSLFVPGKIFSANWLLKGILPLWNPTILGGISWIGDINQSLLYPSTALFMITDAASALNITIVIHFLISYVGMYRLSRSQKLQRYPAIIASILWTFSTQMTVATNNVSVLQSLSWFPWIILYASNLDVKKNWIKLCILIAIQTLAGYPQHLMFSVSTGFIFYLASNSKMSLLSALWTWIKVGLVSVSVAAVVLLPFAETLSNSTRTTQSTDQALENSLHPLMLMKIFSPHIWEKPTAGYRWGPAWNGSIDAFMYITWIGLIGLVIGSLSRKSKLLFYWGILLFIYAFGRNITPIGNIQSSIPILNSSRYPSLSIIPLTLIASLVSAQGIMRIKRSLLKISCILLVIAAIPLTLISLSMNFLPTMSKNVIEVLLSSPIFAISFFNTDRAFILAKNLSTSFAIHALAASGVAYFLKYKIMLLVILLISIDMIWSTSGELFFAPKNIYDPPKVQYAFQKDAHARILTKTLNAPYADFSTYWEATILRQPFSDSYVDEAELADQKHLRRLKQGLSPNWNMSVGIDTIHGYTALIPEDFSRIWQSDDKEARINFLAPIDPTNSLLDDWSVTTYLDDTWFPATQNTTSLNKSSTNSTLVEYSRPNSLAKYRYKTGQAASIQDESITPNTISFDIDSSNQDLIIANRFDSGWKAYVNDRETKLKPFRNMQLISLQKGNSKVRLTYLPSSFILGSVISVSTLMFLVIVQSITKKYE